MSLTDVSVPSKCVLGVNEIKESQEDGQLKNKHPQNGGKRHKRRNKDQTLLSELRVARGAAEGPARRTKNKFRKTSSLKENFITRKRVDNIDIPLPGGRAGEREKKKGPASDEAPINKTSSFRF